MLIRSQLHPSPVTGVDELDWKKIQKVFTFIDGTSFKLAGDQTAIFQVARAIRINNVTGYILETTVVADETTILVSTDFGATVDLVEVGHDADSSPARVVILDRDPVPEDNMYQVGMDWYNNIDRKFFTCIHIYDIEGTAAWKGEDGSFIGATTETPVLSCDLQGFEGLHHEVTITNYDAAKVYEVSVGGGTASRIDGIITWVLPNIPSSIPVDYIITVTATALNKEVSLDATKTVEVLELNIVDDQAIVLEGSTFLRSNFQTPGELMPSYSDWSDIHISDEYKSGTTGTTLANLAYFKCFNDNRVIFVITTGSNNFTLKIGIFNENKSLSILQTVTDADLFPTKTYLNFSSTILSIIKLSPTRFAIIAFVSTPALGEQLYAAVVGTLVNGTYTFDSPVAIPVNAAIDTVAFSSFLYYKGIYYYEENKVVIIDKVTGKIIIMYYDPTNNSFSFGISLSCITGGWDPEYWMSDINDNIGVIDAYQSSGGDKCYLRAFKIDGGEFVLGSTVSRKSLIATLPGFTDLDTTYAPSYSALIGPHFDDHTLICVSQAKNTNGTVYHIIYKITVDPDTLVITANYGDWYRHYRGGYQVPVYHIKRGNMLNLDVGTVAVNFAVSESAQCLTIWEDTGTALEIISPDITTTENQKLPITFGGSSNILPHAILANNVVIGWWDPYFYEYKSVLIDHQYLLTTDTLKSGDTILFDQEGSDTDWQRYQNTTREEFHNFTLETGTGTTVLKLRGISNMLVANDIVILEDGTQATLNTVTEVPLGSNESVYTCGINELPSVPTGIAYFGMSLFYASIGKNDEYLGDDFACALFSSDSTIIQCELDRGDMWKTNGYHQSVGITVDGNDAIVDYLSLNVEALGATWRYTFGIPTQASAPTAMWKPSTFREDIVDTVSILEDGRIQKVYTEHYCVNEGIRQIEYKWQAVQEGVKLCAINGNLTKTGA